MASTISVLGEPERVNLVVWALKPDYLLLDIFTVHVLYALVLYATDYAAICFLFFFSLS